MPVRLRKGNHSARLARRPAPVRGSLNERIQRYANIDSVLGIANTSMSYDEVRNADKNLTYRGDFEKDSPGDRFTRAMWEKDASKFDNPKYAEKVARRAHKIESAKDPEKALQRAQDSVARRGAAALNNG